MNGNLHFMFGCAVGISASVLANADATTSTLLISTAMIGSIFPDIDNPTSHFGQLTKPISSFVSAFSGKGSNHRGIIHSLLFGVGGLLLSYFFFKPLIGLFIGILSHLLLDSFNPSGIPLGIGFKRLHLGKIPCDSKYCTLVTVVMLILVLSIGFFLKQRGVDLSMYINTSTETVKQMNPLQH